MQQSARLAALEQSRSGQVLVRVAAYAVLVVLTISVAIAGVFLIPAGPVILGANCSWAWPFAVVGNLFLIQLARRIDEFALVVIVPAVVWLLTFLVLGRQGPTGHILEPAGAAGYGFLFAGFATFVYGVFTQVVPRGTRRRGVSRSRATRRAQ